MKRSIVFLLLTVLFVTGCGKKSDADASIIGGSDGPTAVYVAPETEKIPADEEFGEDIWQTASIGYEYEGELQPEYYVQFTDKEIIYGHMSGNEFVYDHSDKIGLIEKTSNGYRVQAESQNGIKYTYQTGESDKEVLEYFETWNEEEFPDMYRGGASLSKQPN